MTDIEIIDAIEGIIEWDYPLDYCILLDRCKLLLEKEVAAEPVSAENSSSKLCPVCGGSVVSMSRYCSSCGQRLDWSNLI